MLEAYMYRTIPFLKLSFKLYSENSLEAVHGGSEKQGIVPSA